MPLGRNRMNNQDAKAFFKEYNGLEYHMFHDGTLKYKEYEKLHISPSVKELWRQELIEEHFEKLEDPNYKEMYGIVVGRLIEVLFTVSTPVEPHLQRLIHCLSTAASTLDELQKIRILEHMAGHRRDHKDGGIYLIRTFTGLEKELKECLDGLSDFRPSEENLARYLRAVHALERLIG